MNRMFLFLFIGAITLDLNIRFIVAFSRQYSYLLGGRFLSWSVIFGVIEYIHHYLKYQFPP